MAGNDVFLYSVPAFGSPNDVKLTDPNTLAGGSGATTTPTITASRTWAAFASLPIVDVIVPVVSAPITWAAFASTPIFDVFAPSVSSAFAWSASPSAPLIGILAPTVTASFTWSASSLAPLFDTIAPAVSSAFTWDAFADTPIIGAGGDITAPSVQASRAWSAFSAAPVIEEQIESIGNYGQIGNGPIAPRRHARITWQANASAPRIGAAPVVVFDVTAPRVHVTCNWLARPTRPRGMVLARTRLPLALIRSPKAEPLQLRRSTHQNLIRS